MRAQQIKHTGTGAAFVTFYGKKLMLDTFMRVDSEYYTYKGKSLKVHGYASNGYGAYLINVSDDGETAIVTYRQN